MTKLTLALVTKTLSVSGDIPFRRDMQMVTAGAWNVIHTLYPRNVGADMAGRLALAESTELGIDYDTIGAVAGWLAVNYESQLAAEWQSAQVYAERYL